MIRAYSSKDKDDLLALIRLNMPAFFHPDEEQDFRDYLNHHARHYYVIEDEGMVLGAGGINYFEDDGSAKLSWDLVHPDAQGKGYGSQLVHFRITEVKTQPAINLLIVRTSQLVYKFYEKAGFKLVRKQKDYWAEGFDLYQMEMKLR
ncbi:GNAT family N-acetyltransferase [Pontibacter sp. SGAir0037]|nr:GNAT family N-acetyltransferase [Pontibacter sp. SGAir0037]